MAECSRYIISPCTNERIHSYLSADSSLCAYLLTLDNIIVGLTLHCPPSSSSSSFSPSCLSSSIPHPIKFSGFLFSSSQSSTSTLLSSPVLSDTTTALLVGKYNGTVIEWSEIQKQIENTNVQVTITEEATERLEKYQVFRILANKNCMIFNEKSIESQIDLLQSRITSPSTSFVCQVENSSPRILLTPSSSLDPLLSALSSTRSSTATTKLAPHPYQLCKNIIDTYVHTISNKDDTGDGMLAPKIDIYPNSPPKYIANIHIDALIYMDLKTLTIETFFQHVKMATQKQLLYVKEVLVNALKTPTALDSSVIEIQPLHFAPAHTQHLLTVIYPPTCTSTATTSKSSTVSPSSSPSSSTSISTSSSSSGTPSSSDGVSFELSLDECNATVAATASSSSPSSSSPDLEFEARSDPSYSYRESLHTLFCLPADRPLLRPQLSLYSSTTSAPTTISDENMSDKLLNVHLNVGESSGVVNGTRYMTYGFYSYFHYNQDRFIDSGWGCAYRTLETLCSWFYLQAYVVSKNKHKKNTNLLQAHIPTHREIQELLVSIGDKPSSLIGSKEWIGAVEVGLVLTHQYGVVCKTLFVSDGAEVPAHSRALANHFSKEGTPVMIGGGALAYGLIGIHYNSETGDVRYLILDPHYTGRDDIGTIIKQGWCGWKDKSLFLKGQFYNFCLPQRPRVV